MYVCVVACVDVCVNAHASVCTFLWRLDVNLSCLNCSSPWISNRVFHLNQELDNLACLASQFAAGIPELWLTGGLTNQSGIRVGSF